MDDSLARLVSGVEVLCLDAGNTVIFLDHARLARLVAAHGHAIDRDTLVRAEGAAKLAQERRALLEPAWSGSHAPGARDWGGVIGTLLVAAGVPEVALPALLPHLWADHLAWNLFSAVPPELPAALRRARSAGVKIAIVSNSEGGLEPLFDRLGILPLFDRVVDSAIVGFTKPDPRIFHEALSTWGTSPDHALHLGDSIATDVAGARAAGIRVALIDPFGHCEGRAPDVPRVASVAAVADALADR